MQPFPRKVPEMPKVVGAEVAKLMLFTVAADILHRIQLRRIGWQIRQPHGAIAGVDVLLDEPAAMGLESIPDDEQLPSELPPQVVQEVHDLGTPDRPGIQSEVEGPHRDSRDYGQSLPVEGQLHDQRLSPRRPGAHPVGPFAQARLVDEDDHAAVGCGVFLKKIDQAEQYHCGMRTR